MFYVINQLHIDNQANKTNKIQFNNHHQYTFYIYRSTHYHYSPGWRTILH